MKKISKGICFLAAAVTLFASAPLQAKAAGESIAINKSNFPDAGMRKFVKKYDRNRDNKLSLNERTRVVEMFLHGNDIYEIKNLKGIEYFCNLQKIELNYLEMEKSPDFSKLKKLKTVFVHECTFPAVDLRKNKALNWVDISGSNIDQVLLGKEENLKKVGIDSDYLRSIDVSGCANLTDLYIYNTQITDIDLSKQTKLKQLVITENKSLSKIDLSKCVNLTNIEISGTQIAQINLSKQTKLKDLMLDKNKLSALDVSQSKNLTSLSCKNNVLSQLDVSALSKLTNLDCSHNVIKSLDLSKNTKMKVLNASHNQLTPETFLKNEKLDYAGLNNNKFGYVEGVRNPEAPQYYCITLNETEPGVLDFSKVIDSSKIEAITNARLENGKLYIQNIEEPVTYTYDKNMIVYVLDKNRIYDFSQNAKITYDQTVPYHKFQKQYDAGVVVTWNDFELTEGIDYTLTYQKNTKPGTASVTVNGIGQFKGSITKEFKIDVQGLKSILCKPTTTGFSITPNDLKQNGMPLAPKTFPGKNYCDGYEVSVYDAKKKSYKVVKKSPITKKTEIKGLKSGTKVKYSVRTYITIDGKKYYSNSAVCENITTLTAAPKKLKVKKAKNKLTLSFSKVSKAEAYEIEIIEVNGKKSKSLKNIKTKKTNASISVPMKKGRKYTVKVTSINTAHVKGKSITKTITCK